MKFRLELNGSVMNYRATSAAEFLNDCCYATDDYLFYVDDVLVARNAAMAAAREVLDAKWGKKSETHKRVRVSVGASRADSTYREVWVKKES